MRIPHKAVLSAATITLGAAMFGASPAQADATAPAPAAPAVHAKALSCWNVAWTPWYKKGRVYGGGSSKCTSKVSLLVNGSYMHGYKGGGFSTSGKNCKKAKYCASYSSQRNAKGNQSWCASSTGNENGAPINPVPVNCEHRGF